MRQSIFVIMLSLLLSVNSLSAKNFPIGVRFQYETVTRKGINGDNWCQTWASDGNIYTMMDDGNGLWDCPKPEREGSMCIQIGGDADFTDSDVKKMPGWPKNNITSPFYAYGTVSVDGVIYVWLWKSETSTWYRRPIANRLLYSPDLGMTLYRWTGEKETSETFADTKESSFFFYKEDPKWKLDRNAYAFNWIAFCQNGKDNSAAKDKYVYMYAPEQYDPKNLSMIRVDKRYL